MPSAHLNPQTLKNCLLNSVDIGKETGPNPIFPMVALTVDADSVQAYGRSSFTVGWSFDNGMLEANSSNTCLISWDEAKDLGAAVGKTSAAKDATVFVNIEDGRLAVDYGRESIADLPGIEPGPGDIEGINQDLEILRSAGSTPRTHFAMTTEVVKRFSKIRTRSPIIDLMFTSIGSTVFTKVGPNFVGGFEAVDRNRVNDPEPMLFS